jgi:hypothetical protein
LPCCATAATARSGTPTSGQCYRARACIVGRGGCSYLQGQWHAKYAAYPPGYAASPRFVLGVAMFVAGMAINVRHDAILRNLRKPGESGYKIPRVGCPVMMGAPGRRCRWRCLAAATLAATTSCAPSLPCVTPCHVDGGARRAACLSWCQAPTSWAR